MASGVGEANEVQRQRPGVRGQCPGGDSEPNKVIFNVYTTFFFSFFLLGGNREWWVAPPGAAHRS